VDILNSQIGAKLVSLVQADEPLYGHSIQKYADKLKIAPNQTAVM
jgi:hypothetical protein